MDAREIEQRPERQKGEGRCKVERGDDMQRKQCWKEDDGKGGREVKQICRSNFFG